MLFSSFSRLITGFLFSLTIIASSYAAKDDKDCVRWGGQFDVPLRSKNVRKDCALPDGRPVCCAAVLSNSSYTSRGIGYSYQPPKPTRDVNADRSRIKVTCDVTKIYISSPQEERDLHMSIQLEKITNVEQRLDSLLKYVTSNEMLQNSTIWLNRVSAHMQSEQILSGTDADREFLSRFHVTRKCGNGIGPGVDTVEWDEWIEPINIAARHPFAFSRCRNAWQYFTNKQTGVDRSDVDYVLLQSGVALADTAYVPGKRVRPKDREEPNKHYLLDAGTSTFDSSLSWFTCAYSQRGISFNQVFAWEMTLIDPREYWLKVPAKWKAFWHFFNTPISADSTHPDSPVRLIRQITAPADFVSFKLDIDHPDTEMPVALALLSDPVLAGLVDEFFFELHFQCEVMTSCGWGKKVPVESHGLKLDRPHVLQFFLDLRKKGIRAHIWP